MNISNRCHPELVLIVLALIFGWLGTASLWLQSRDPLVPFVMAVLSFAGLGSHVILNSVARYRDPLIFPIALLLSAWGILVIARVAANFLGHQVAWIAIGCAVLCAVAASRDRLRWLRRFKYTWLLACLALLGATLLLGVNPGGGDARLWLSLAGLFLQPSEILRLLMIAFLAAFFSERLVIHYAGIGIRDWWRNSDRSPVLLLQSLAPLAPSFLMWLVALSLLVTQQDFGPSVLLLVIYAFMLYLATGELALPVTGVGLMIAAGTAGVFLSTRIAQRISIWMNPWADPQGASFQIVQSLLAVASGGILGQGPGQGRPDYVPAVHTDFPFVAIGEEYGLIGTLAVITLFALLVLRAWRIARASPSTYGMFLAGGLASLFCTQVFVIIGGNLGLLPLTGVTLPFVSYGGSSMLVSFIAVGLLLRLSSDQQSVLQPKQQAGTNGTATAIRPVNGGAARAPAPNQRTAARRGMLACALLLSIVAIGSGYRGVIERDGLVARDDNPRNVDAERAILRGPILARDGTPLAVSVAQTSTSRPGWSFVRRYPYSQAASVVGYYSLWHGVGGVEEREDAKLRGGLTPLDHLLHRSQVGAPFTTTIDLDLQINLANALSGTVGAGIIMDWHTGEVLALVSTPIFDPNTLDDNWDQLRARVDAPLVNRVTQGLYQPGALLQWMYAQNLPGHITGSSTHWDPTDRFHLGTPVTFELDNASVPYPTVPNALEAEGQGSLRVTPLRIAVAVASLAARSTVTPTIAGARAPKSAMNRPGDPGSVTGTRVFAQMGANRDVGWSIDVGSTTVIVLALELPNSNTDQLEATEHRLPRLP